MLVCKHQKSYICFGSKKR